MSGSDLVVRLDSDVEMAGPTIESGERAAEPRETTAALNEAPTEPREKTPAPQEGIAEPREAESAPVPERTSEASAAVPSP